MKWFEVQYLIGGVRFPFCCVRAWNRREAYQEVALTMAQAVRDRHGRRPFLWDTEDIER